MELAMSEEVWYSIRAFVQAQPAILLLLACMLLLAGIVLRRYQYARTTHEASREDARSLKQKSSGSGVLAANAWTPVDFKRPTAAPYPDWDITTTKPLPYRPFRYGPKYNITMGLRPMQWDEWIELDNEYLHFHALRASRIATVGHKCIRTDAIAHASAVELLEELVDYLPERYPTMFARTATGIRNTWSSEVVDSTNLTYAASPSAQPSPSDPMTLCARLVPDDIAIMLPTPSGHYHFLAGAILLAGAWRLEDKFGMSLSEIHTSGDVAGYESKLEKGMMNFFRRLKPESPVLRNNYMLQMDGELEWSSSLGPEGEWTGKVEGWKEALLERPKVQDMYFRSERQSLRRLPRTGGIVFTIRTYFLPIMKLAQEPYVPGRLASAVRSWGDDVARYKGKERFHNVLLEYLDRRHREQVEDGLELGMENDVRAYPY